ncbi:asparaginase [Balamuthia mandrillaris]
MTTWSWRRTCSRSTLGCLTCLTSMAICRFMLVCSDLSCSSSCSSSSSYTTKAAMNRSTQTLLRLLKVTAVPPMDVRPHDPSEQTQTYFELLSDELIFLIFKQLHPLSELPTVSQVCRRFCHIAGDPHLRTFLSIEASNRRGQRLVHMAAQQGLTEVVAALIELKADIHARNKLHITPLFLAAEHGRHEILKLLIAAGGNVHDRDSNNHTPLHAAAWGCHSRCIILLLKHGASALAVDDKGDTPLSSALKYGSLSPSSCSTSSFLLAFNDPTKEARMEQERKLVRGLLA